MNKFDVLAILVLLASIPISVIGLGRMHTNMEDVLQWLPDESPARGQYDWFVSNFGTDDFVLVTWEGCDRRDPRAEQLARLTRQLDKEGLIQKMVVGPDLLKETQERLELSEDKLAQRFSGSFLGRDRRQSVVLAVFSQAGMQRRRDAIQLLESAADEVKGLDASQLVFGGYPYVGAYADREIKATMLYLVVPSCLLSLVIAWAFLRSVRDTVALLVPAGLAALLSISAVTLCGYQWGGLTSIIPVLAFVLTLSGAVHLVHYSKKVAEPTAEVLFGLGCKPCSMSAFSTALGMLSLTFSNFQAVRDFGFQCAMALVLSWLLTLSLVPFLLARLGSANWPSNRKADWIFDRLYALVIRQWGVVLVLFAVVGAVLGYHLLHLRADLEVERFFAKNSTLFQEVGWLEDKLGPMEQTELLVVFDENGDDGLMERYQLIQNIQSHVTQRADISTTISACNFLPEVPSRGALQQTVARTHAKRAIKQLAENRSYVVRGADEEVWRISLRIPFLRRTDFGELKSQVLSAAEASVEQSSYSPQFRYTGVAHLYHVAQEDVIADLVGNFALAGLMIFPLFIFGLRSLSLGSVAMIPNLAPSIVVFGAMGFADYPLDMAIAMTACVALGIAVDDTSHLLVQFQRYAASDPDPQFAFRHAYQTCGNAMLQTTAIASGGLLVFLFCSIAAVERFTVILVALLVMALLCDLILLPALLKVCGFLTASREPAEQKAAHESPQPSETKLQEQSG